MLEPINYHLFTTEEQEKYIGDARLKSYTNIEEYTKNINTIQNLWQYIHFIEVAIRNKIVQILTAIQPNKTQNIAQNWYYITQQDSDNFYAYIKQNTGANPIGHIFPTSQINKRDKDTLAYCIKKIASEQARHLKEYPTKPITKDILISRLPFGFWPKIYSYICKQFHLNQILNKDALNKLEKLRNRMAHHENILKGMDWTVYIHKQPSITKISIEDIKTLIEQKIKEILT